ncbi:alkylated DNA repair protein alkB8-like [Tropilaelaps mercedesae]|uniref:Alkylated DNA repair protein alkB8-like n=1 Tax=Tropilaelaps mercedesae TaxID=418985 RepID=A0A1V9X2N8_9ACAR|nr:alkylated DNA repair protein alkB8-like [Tropilaelaps mercedesae]
MGINKGERTHPNANRILEKKHHRKLIKVMNSVENDFGARLSPVPTKFVVLSNAGLANGATTPAILKALSELDLVQGNQNCSSDSGSAENLACQPILPPDKHYSFLRCATVEIAKKAVAAVSGKSCFDFLGVQPTYAGFIDRGQLESEVPAPQLCFGPLPSGLTILENRISIEEELEWLELLTSSRDSKPSTGILAANQAEPTASLRNRQVEHFGYNFDYSINSVRRNQPLLDKPLPLLCLRFMERLHHEGLLDECHLPDQLTVNRYPPGAGIPAHCDTHSMSSSCIIVVSLGADIVMEFRRPHEGSRPSIVTVLVRRGSVMFMSDESRYGWTHSIAQRKYDLIPAVHQGVPPVAIARAERVSFTFRKIRSAEVPCACAFPSLCDSQLRQNLSVELSLSAREASRLEEMHVHEVYDDIAKHFSETRYRQWPRVAEFLHALPKGAFVADFGCGNGKNMRVEGRPDLAFFGSDRSIGLLEICRQRKLEVARIDCVQLPIREGVFDAAICIAVLHHLANLARRRQSLWQLIQAVRSGGKILVYVWAKEQRYSGVRSKYLRDSVDAENSSTGKGTESIADRNFIDGQREHPKTQPDSDPVELKSRKMAFIELRDSTVSIPVHTNRSDFTAGTDILVPWSKVAEGQVKHRFYHVFREGELRSLVNVVAAKEDGQHLVTIEDEYYDEGNWCVVLTKQ